MSKDIILQTNQNNQDKKNTKKKELTNKERINAILEKYNLKTPKKTQIIDKKTNFQIKPKSTNNETVIQPPKLTVEPAQQPKPQFANAGISVIARPNMSACMSWVPS